MSSEIHAEVGLLSSLVTAPGDAVVLAASDGRVLACNEAAPPFFGRSREELLGHPAEQLFEEGNLAACLALPGRPWEVRLLRPDGATLDVELVCCLLEGRAPCERNVVLHVRDLAGRRRLEDQLLQVQHLEEVGRLSGGVAHDFNNLFTVILSAVESASELIGSGSPAAEDLAAIQQAARHASQMTRQLLAFARRSLAQSQLVDADELLRNLARMLGPLLGKGVRLEMEISDEELPVQAEPMQLEQLFLNLAMNAREAMAGKGQLTLSVRGLTAEEARAFEHQGPAVLFSVRDTGCGMSEDVRARLFEAFFTTKARGTGIGLAACKGIVQRLGGTIRVESLPGTGTTFQVVLPKRERPRAPALVHASSGPPAAAAQAPGLRS